MWVVLNAICTLEWFIFLKAFDRDACFDKFSCLEEIVLLNLWSDVKRTELAGVLIAYYWLAWRSGLAGGAELVRAPEQSCLKTLTIHEKTPAL